MTADKAIQPGYTKRYLPEKAWASLDKEEREETAIPAYNTEDDIDFIITKIKEKYPKEEVNDKENSEEEVIDKENSDEEEKIEETNKPKKIKNLKYIVNVSELKNLTKKQFKIAQLL